MSLVILCHPFHGFGEHYLLYRLGQLWNQQGIPISVAHGVGPRAEGDVVVNHVDLTETPVEYLAYMRQYKHSVNGHVADISKRTVSKNLVCQCDSYNGPVIVKSNLNCGGWQEANMARAGLLPRTYDCPVTEYLHFEHADQVPEEVWRDRSRVVEKFLPEREGDLFVLRVYMFCGEAEVGGKAYSTESIVKNANYVRREESDEIPQELRDLRAELGFDYGRFDFAMPDGETVVFDTNRTPVAGNFTPEVLMPRLKRLAKGIDSLLEERI